MQAKLALAKEAARQAGRCILKHYEAPEIMEKASHNLVTVADLASEKIITQLIRDQYPDHALLAEEGLQDTFLGSEHLWLIDPLDGTNNYAHHFPHFCVSIAYAKAGKLQVGVVYDPVREEMFTASRGEGAYLNEMSLSPSKAEHLQQAIVGTGFYYERGFILDLTLRKIRELFSANIQGIRRTGAAALDLCWVAAGRLDAFFEYRLSPWDFAAAALIIEEAGGRVTNRCGQPLKVDSLGIAAANEHLLEPLLNIVQWQEDSNG